MSADELQHLRAQIDQLKKEVEDREADLAHYRHHLTQANIDLEKLIQRINEELELAQKLQRLLVPTELPSIPGFDLSSKFVASLERGGDYFDVFTHQDKFEFGILLAASSGHVMAALLLGALLKFTGEMEAKRGLSPRELLDRVADELRSKQSASHTAHIAYLKINRRNYRLEWASSGDLMIVFWRASDQSWLRIGETTQQMSPGQKTEIIENSLDLNSGDKLIMGSPGLWEAQNSKGEMLGKDRLYRIIQHSIASGVHELRNQVLFQVEQFCGDMAPVRDRTIIVLEVKDQVIKLAKHQ